MVLSTSSNPAAADMSASATENAVLSYSRVYPNPFKEISSAADNVTATCSPCLTAESVGAFPSIVAAKAAVPELNMANTIISGERIATRMSIIKANCTFVMSVVRRVTSEGVEN